ncbi:MAG: class I SAM-dependent methyltransferase [Pseudomonadota bacterium]
MSESPVTHIDQITEQFEDVRCMNAQRAHVLRDLLVAEDAENVLEIGFFKGKSSAYIAAMLEDRGRGHLTTVDRKVALKREPNIHTVLEQAKLSHRVTPVFAKRSFTWELKKLIEQDPRPQFDLCYFDGGHTWDVTGFGMVLVDMLMRPGGLIVLDDLDWTINRSRHYQRNPSMSKKYSADERDAPGVRLAWELVLPHLGYVDRREIPEVGWATAKKPA